MWELDCEEVWVLKNWCFWSVVLEKTPESPLDFKEIQPFHSEGDQPWDFFGRNDAKAETPVFWPAHVKSWLIGKDPDTEKDWGQERKGAIKGEMVEWHHRFNGHELEQIQGDSKGQGSLVCCSPRGLSKEVDLTYQLNNNDPHGTNLHMARILKHMNFSYFESIEHIWQAKDRFHPLIHSSNKTFTQCQSYSKHWGYS